MSIATFIPEVWSAELLVALRKSLVYQALSNRDYEGEIAGAGDTVHINSVSDPTIKTYAKGDTVTYEGLDTVDRTLVIDQSKLFAFAVDDIDKRQAAGNVIVQAMARSAYRLADLSDQLIAQACVDTNTANVIAQTSITTGDLAYTGLVSLNQKLDEANVAKEGRVVVLPPWYLALLFSNALFTNAFAAGQPAAQTTGYIRTILGMDVYESNNTPNSASSAAVSTFVAGNANVSCVIAGVPSAITFADQLSEVEALRLQTTVADAVRGLHLYGAKLTRPDSIAVLKASQV
jgi:hypothetical protein